MHLKGAHGVCQFILTMSEAGKEIEYDEEWVLPRTDR